MGNQLHKLKHTMNSEGKMPLSSIWKELLANVDLDDLSAFILSSFPSNIINNGVENHKGLHNRFLETEKAGIKATYLPQNPTMWGHALSEIFSLLHFRERDLDALQSDNSDY